MEFSVLTPEAVRRRAFWITEIVQISGNFGQDAHRVEQELVEEVATASVGVLLDHLRLCGAIPESFGRDTSAEKLYAKYTDSLLAVSFRAIGLTSVVLPGRGDAADIEVVGPDLALVADAKAFRLSRTAKNQKDFKIQALDGWKRGKPFALVAGPLHQMPATRSQIYLQAISRNVCLLSFSHVALLVAVAMNVGQAAARAVLHSVLRCVAAMPPTKDAFSYWNGINRTFLDADGAVLELWRIEKIANLEAIAVAKEESLVYLATERARMLGLSREEAIARLLRTANIDGRMRVIAAVRDNGLLDLE